MELKQYFELFRRWVWLLILGLVLGAAGGFFGSRYQAPVYQASTRILVMRAPQEKSSDMTYLSDQQLTQTYVQLVTTRPVIDATSVQVGYDIDPEWIKVQQLRDTQIIQITIENQDPRQAASIANTLVEVLIERNEDLQAGRYTTTEESLQAQLDQVDDQITNLQTQVTQLSSQNLKDQMKQVEVQITPLQDEVSLLQKEIATLTPAYTLEKKALLAEKQSRLAQIQPLLTLYQQIYSNLVVLGKPMETGSEGNINLTQLQTTLGLYQQIYINLLNSLESVRLARLQNTPNVVQIEPATAPEKPVRPRPVTNTLLAGAVGLMLSAGAAFLVEYLDDTLKTPADVERALGLSVIGYIADMQSDGKSAEGVYVKRQPRSPVSEAFRSLRTNLEFAGVDKPIRTILVTSPGPAEGKSTIASNLAVIMSQGGKRVVLLDADMRRPCIHRILGMSNRIGLSDLFRDHSGIHTVIHAVADHPGLAVITSGKLPPNPVELLGSERMTQILLDLNGRADVVVIDTPPCMVADAQVLAGKVDVVLLVVQPGHTHADAAVTTLEAFNRAGARVVGVVLNRIPRNRAYYYGGYRYYYSRDKSYKYYSDNGSRSASEENVHSDEPIHSRSLLTRLIHSTAKDGKPKPSLHPDEKG